MSFGNVKPLIAMALLTFVAACATGGGHQRHASKGPSVRPNPHEKIGNPYQIKGITYVPREDPDYKAVGVASWYGPQFHGKLTANGELFDMNRLTAAHKTLPLPSIVRVTNLDNGKSAVLRLNDRGPFAGDRIIDLSRAAAEKLGTKKQGLGMVQVEYLGPARLDDAIVSIGAREDYAALQPKGRDLIADEIAIVNHIHSDSPIIGRAAPSSEPVTVAYAAPTYPEPQRLQSPDVSTYLPQYFVQVGAFQSVENARAARQALPVILPVMVTTEPHQVSSSFLHFVKIGPYTHEFAALEARKVAISRGFSDAHIVQNDLAN